MPKDMGKDAIKLGTVPLDKKYPEETVLPEDVLYRYLYQPGEQRKRRATDFICRTNMYRLDRIAQEPDNLSCNIYKMGLIVLLCVKN